MKATGAKTLEAAHSRIDTLSMLEGLGGLFIALGHHYRTVLKESPKMKQWKEAKARKKAVADAKRKGTVIDVPGREVEEVTA